MRGSDNTLRRPDGGWRIIHVVRGFENGVLAAVVRRGVVPPNKFTALSELENMPGVLAITLRPYRREFPGR